MPGRETEPGIVYRFGKELFYANHEIRRRSAGPREAGADPRALVHRRRRSDHRHQLLRRASIRDLLDDLTREGVGVVFAHVSPYLRSDMDRHRITAVSARRGFSRHSTKPSRRYAVVCLGHM